LGLLACKWWSFYYSNMLQHKHVECDITDTIRCDSNLMWWGRWFLRFMNLRLPFNTLFYMEFQLPRLLWCVLYIRILSCSSFWLYTERTSKVLFPHVFPLFHTSSLLTVMIVSLNQHFTWIWNFYLRIIFDGRLTIFKITIFKDNKGHGTKQENGNSYNHMLNNKRKEKTTEQWKIENPETHATLVTRYITITSKTKT
jgi:hypothetical protein